MKKQSNISLKDKIISSLIFFLAIKTGRYTHEKRSQDIREVKKLETGSPDCVPAVISCQDMEESKDLAMILVDAQKDMYGPKFEYWINDDTIYELAQDYLVRYNILYKNLI